MLPRVATTTGTVQPTPALPAGGAVDGAAKPQPSAAALANLRAEVLLRLIETLLKHMPRTGEPSPNRDLLETLLSVLKTLPGREGESGPKLADLIAKLTPEMRPSIEKLIGTVLSAMPTRNLIEILRNPNGPDAQKLAGLLAAKLVADDAHATGQTQQKPLSLNAQQLAAIGRQGAQQAAQVAQLIGGDARALQATLKRIFDFDSASKPRVATTRAAETPAARVELSNPGRLASETSGVLRSADARAPLPAFAIGGQPPVEATETAARHHGDAEEPQTTTPATRREEVSAKTSIANSAGQALARSVLQAVARDLPPALLTQAVAHLVENLSPEEANFLRALLERPLDLIEPPQDGFTNPELAPTEEFTAEIAAAPESEMANAELPEEAMKARPETAQPASAPIRAATPDDIRTAARLPETNLAAAQAAAPPDLAVPVAAAVREGIPLAFVPYLPAEEDLEWSDGREAEKDELGEDEESTGSEGEDTESGDEDMAGEDEAETPDMARRREKTTDMVGVIEPGLVFYQKLGDYWT